LIGFLFIFNFESPSFIYNTTLDKKKTTDILDKVYVSEYSEIEFKSIEKLHKLNKSKQEIGFK